MDGEIIPRGIVLDRAKRAVESGSALEAASPWPVGTAAGQMFVAEFHAERALRQASERQRVAEQGA